MNIRGIKKRGNRPGQRPSSVAITLALLGFAFVLWGCGSNVGTITAPLASQKIDVEVVPVPGDLQQGVGGEGDANEVVAMGGITPVVTDQVSATTGGQIVCGRHILTVPPGALDHDTEITLVDLTSVRGYVSVCILPDGLIFRNNPTLQSQVSDFGDPATFSMFRIHVNPSGKEVWSNIGGSASPDGLGIVASIPKTGIHAARSS